MLVVLTWLILGLLAPVLPIQEPDTVKGSRPVATARRDHIFGTDDVGREILSRVILGRGCPSPRGSPSSS